MCRTPPLLSGSTDAVPQHSLLDITAFLQSSESSPTPTLRPEGAPPTEGWWLSPSQQQALEIHSFHLFSFPRWQWRAAEMSNLSSSPHFKRGTHQQGNGFWEGPCCARCHPVWSAQNFSLLRLSCVMGGSPRWYPAQWCVLIPTGVPLKSGHSRGSFFKPSHQSSDEVHLLCSLGLRYFLVFKAIQLTVGTIHYLRLAV